MRKSQTWLIIAIALLLMLAVGTTIAYLVASSNIVQNTFTVGAVNISLTETTGKTYALLPGATLEKDPVVTVHSGSENCWLFVKVEEDHDLDAYCTYSIEAAWTPLEGYDGVFYQTVEKSIEDQTFPVLKDNSVQIRDTLHEEQLNAIEDYPTIKFTAYAIQGEGVATVEDAWLALEQGREE